MQRGFTLVELIVVLAVIAIVAGLAVPKIGQSMAAWELDTAARQLVGDLRWTQQLVINSGGVGRPIFYFKTTSPYGYYVQKNLQVIKNVNFPASVTVSVPSPASVSFDTNGRPFAGVTTIVLNSTNARVPHKTIFIEVMTGRIRIE